MAGGGEGEALAERGECGGRQSPPLRSVLEAVAGYSSEPGEGAGRAGPALAEYAGV